MNRKKWCLFLFVILTLTAYGRYIYQNQDTKHLEGVVAEVQTDDSGEITSFVVKSGKEVRILLTEETTLWPKGAGTWTRTQILNDIRPDTWVDVWYYPHPVRQRVKDQQIRAYSANSVYITGELTREVLTFQDGISVDMVEFGELHRLYRLADGTELLRVEVFQRLENAAASGIDESTALSAQAQKKIEAYYETQGLIFNEIEELKNIYASYFELGKEFRCVAFYQMTQPAGISERVAYYETGVSFPTEYGSNSYSSVTLCAAFDRETGDQINTWDLFAVSEAEVRRRLPELTGWIDDKTLIEEMAEALNPAWIRISSQDISVMFPPGSLPSSENGYLISVDSKNIPEKFLQPWAVPVETTN